MLISSSSLVLLFIVSLRDLPFCFAMHLLPGKPFFGHFIVSSVTYRSSVRNCVPPFFYLLHVLLLHCYGPGFNFLFHTMLLPNYTSLQLYLLIRVLARYCYISSRAKLSYTRFLGGVAESYCVVYS